MEAFSIAAAGALAATSRLAASAQRVAGGEGDLATEAVAQISAKTDFAANLAVLRVSDEITKRLLDLRV